MRQKSNNKSTLQTENEVLVFGIVVTASGKGNGVSIATVADISGLSKTTVNRIFNRAMVAGCMKRVNHLLYLDPLCTDKTLIKNAKRAYKTKKSSIYRQLSYIEQIEA